MALGCNNCPGTEKQCMKCLCLKCPEQKHCPEMEDPFNDCLYDDDGKQIRKVREMAESKDARRVKALLKAKEEQVLRVVYERIMNERQEPAGENKGEYISVADICCLFAELREHGV